MFVRVVLTVLLSILVAGAAPASAAEQGPFRLGVLLGLTGPGKPYSEEGLRGIELAVEEINAAGGLMGEHIIELIVRNDRTNPEVAAALARRLVSEDNVQTVIGTYSSASALAIKPILRDAQVLHIAAISNAEEITKIDPSPFTFSVVPNTYMMAKAVALSMSRLAKTEGWTSYVTIASDYAWGRSSQSVQVQLLKELLPDLRLVGEYWPPLGETAFNNYAVAILKAEPDALLESIAGADNELWERTARDYYLVREIARPFGLVSVVELMRERKWLVRGTWARTRAPFFAHLDNPMMRRFADAYRKRYGTWPSDWAVMSYDGVYVLKQGAERAGAIDPDAIRTALTGQSVETTRGTHTFREIDNQLSVSAYVGRISDDPAYDFPIYSDLLELKAEEIWRPESEIRAARGQ